MSSPTKTTIEDLPTEMISELFKHLNPTALATCSMVSKRWHSIYADFKVHSLVAIGNSLYWYQSKWSHSNWRVEEQEPCHLKTLNCLTKPLFSNLKYLALIGNWPRFSLNQLNRFRQLLHLEITWPNDFRKKQVYLNFPHLKVLVVHTLDKDCLLVLDCPELSTLVYLEEEEADLKVKWAETIRKLETNSGDWEWADFKNIECLVIRKFNSIDTNILQLLPNLKELHFNESMENIFKDFKGIGVLDQIKEKLKTFLDDARQLKGADFQFTFAGFQLTNTLLDELDFGVELITKTSSFGESNEYESVSDERFYLANYQLIKPGALHFIHRIDYTRLMSQVPSGQPLPSCFLEKFNGIDVVDVGETVQDESHFLRFLSSLKSLQILRLFAPKLSQEFYNQLPASAPLLVRLQLVENNRNEQQLNFEFVAKFPHLEFQVFYFDVEIRAIQSLALTYISKVEVGTLFSLTNFHFRHDKFIIRKEMNSKTWIVKDAFNQTKLETENPEEFNQLIVTHKSALYRR